MYSPKIYESQIPSLYHAAQARSVPMTQLANAFIYYGLMTGQFGDKSLDLLPHPSKVVPKGIPPKLQLFSLNDQILEDCLNSLSSNGKFDPYLRIESRSPRRPRTESLGGVREYGAS